jgi:GNAT superfamily N-acetyltransferase
VTAARALAWEETLRDGRVVALRPLRSDDAAEVEALWRRLDAPSRRLFTNLAHLPPDCPGEVAVPRPGHTAGIVAVPADPPGRVVGVARYERTAADTARALVFVDASWRRTGLGTVLLRRLAEAARHAGVRLLAGDVPRSDVAMLGLLEDLGLEYEEQVTASVHASFAVQKIDAYLDALLADQRAAARVSVAPFLCPRSIALVGASDKPGSIGALLLANLVASEFAGRTPAQAAAAQAEFGGPVAVKIAAAIHKSDVGGVALDIDSPQAAAEAVTAIRAIVAEAGIAEHAAEFLIQEQIRDGVEMIVGVTHDPAFGPLVLTGLGGTFVEVLGDVAVRITPLSDTDVDEMLRSLRSYRLLTGYRQSPPLDVAAFAELLHRVSAMVEDIPEITELDLNPVFVRQHGAVVADIRVRLTGPAPEPAT